MSAAVVRADALRLPLADESVDLIVTSPPYFALRSYRDEGEHYGGQIGSEATPQAFLEALWAVTAECWRCLEPTGSMFVNLGDKYASSGGHTAIGATSQRQGRSNLGELTRGTEKALDGFRAKSLLGLPWRYAIGCIDGLAAPGGQRWILRAEIVWSKPNGLPESVTDRVRRSHEQWFHLVKSPRYFAAVDEVREAYSPASLATYAAGGLPQRPPAVNEVATNRKPSAYLAGGDPEVWRGNPLGKLPGSVWQIPSEPLIEGDETTWIGKIGFCQRCGKIRLAAGFGPATSTETDMPTTTSPMQESNSPIDSLTNSSSDPSPKASPSTTSAESDTASILSTSNPCPSGSTSSEVPTSPRSTLPRPSASGDTPLTKQTLFGKVADAIVERVGMCDCATLVPLSGPGSVWTVPSEPLLIPEAVARHYDLPDHFAAFPQEWPRRIILGWSPSGICLECGEGRRPAVARESGGPQERVPERLNNRRGTGPAGNGLNVQPTTITGYECGCRPRGGCEPVTSLGAHPAPTRPAVVLDPFGGTGTTAMVARTLGRFGVSVDLSADYCRLARWRIFSSGHGEKAAQRTHRDNQGDLFGNAPSVHCEDVDIAAELL